MEYILMVIAALFAGACIVSLFIEQEILKRVTSYDEKTGELKIKKMRNGEKVSEKVYKGLKAKILYKLFK